MDDDYEARMKERAARRAAAKSAAGGSLESVAAPAPAVSEAPVDDYEVRMKERALKRENSKKDVSEPSPREKSPQPEPEPVQEQEEPEQEAPKREKSPQPEEEAPKEVPKEEPKHSEEDSYKPPRSSRRSELPSSSSRSTPSSTGSSTTSSARSTPSSSASSSSSSRFTPAASASTTTSSPPTTRSAGRERPISVAVASPPTEKKDFGRSNRFSIAPEPNNAPSTQSNGEEPPKRKAISLASKTVEAEDIVKRIVEGDEEVGWVLFNCDQNVQIHSQGAGEVEQLKPKLDDTMVLYGYLRVAVGAEGRTKFVYVRWVGSKIKPIQRAKALDNEKVIKSFTRVYHIEIHTSDKDELTSQKVQDKLARAGGANYDKSQNVGSKTDTNASFSSYKERSRDFFHEKEREGNVRNVVFEKGPMGKTTPVNLSGRTMTVGAASANKNLVDLKTKKFQE